MDAAQFVVLVLATVVFAMFSINLWFSVESYRRHRNADHLRGVVRSAIIEIGVFSIFSGRLIAVLADSADLRRAFTALNAAAVSGALLIGGAFLVVSWLTDDDDDDGAVA